MWYLAAGIMEPFQVTSSVNFTPYTRRRDYS